MEIYNTYPETVFEGEMVQDWIKDVVECLKRNNEELNKEELN